MSQCRIKARTIKVLLEVQIPANEAGDELVNILCGMLRDELGFLKKYGFRITYIEEVDEQK
jgi:hypothetical protein